MLDPNEELNLTRQTLKKALDVLGEIRAVTKEGYELDGIPVTDFEAASVVRSLTEGFYADVDQTIAFLRVIEEQG